MREEMRKQLEQRLYDLTYDMEFIGQESEIWESINMLTDHELLGLVREYEEEEA